MATSKKENDLIQAAVAARLAGKEVDADDLAAQLPEGVEAVPEYSVEDSKEKLLEIAAQLGVEIKKTASKAQIVAALDAEIAAHTVDSETADALLAQKQAQEAADTEDADVENDAQEAAQPVQEGEPLHGYVVTIHHGYTNLRRTPTKDDDNVAQLVESGKRLEVEARVQGLDGQPWFRLLSGLYIVDDPVVTSYGEV